VYYPFPLPPLPEPIAHQILWMHDLMSHTNSSQTNSLFRIQVFFYHILAVLSISHTALQVLQSSIHLVGYIFPSTSAASNYRAFYFYNLPHYSSINFLPIYERDTRMVIQQSASTPHYCLIPTSTNYSPVPSPSLHSCTASKVKSHSSLSGHHGKDEGLQHQPTVECCRLVLQFCISTHITHSSPGVGKTLLQ